MIAINDGVVSVYTVPTDGPESDGTLEWTSATIVIVEVAAGGRTGLGYTYGHRAAAALITGMLPLIRGSDAMAVSRNWIAMTRAIRNQGRPGLASMAIAAVDAALCDASNMPVSTHTAPALHIHPCCAIERIRHLEYFYDHVRIERAFFDGIPMPVGSMLRPDLSRPGFGLEFKRSDAVAYAA